MDEPFRRGEIVKVISRAGPRGDYKIVDRLPVNQEGNREFIVQHSHEPHRRLVPEFWLKRKS